MNALHHLGLVSFYYFDRDKLRDAVLFYQLNNSRLIQLRRSFICGS